jgi:4-amino-4-deoxy-L-arabinose transferase-like glycosyltransferase
VTRGRAWAAVATAAVVPRAAVLLYERGDILSSFTEKSDDFARTFAASGTYGFVPGVPSAYTQPLYGFFLVPVYELFGRTWAAVGTAHIALAALTALLVHEIGRRCVSPTGGVVAALVATLNPYLVWHDVHVNREIVDQPLAAAIVLLALLAADRRSPALAALLGAVTGLAILANSRLVALPLLLAGFVAWRLGSARRAAAGAAGMLAACALVVAPWVVRNRVEVGCFALTTDARALWKANNEDTYDVLDSGRWIDDVPNPPNAPPTPQDAAATRASRGRVVQVDECAQMRFYRRLVLDFWGEHPDEKARLAAQAAGMLWDPRTTKVEGRPGRGTWLDPARDYAQPAYVGLLFVLAAVGATVVPRRLLVLALLLLAYQTAAAMVFVGATRYRAPWDFLLALLAGAALARALAGYRGRSSPVADASAAR